jgi:diaminohydroxyphosphoribosylaminopyrimidine deaminase/5-amino-6-(5-phosphoribosylamino)uracil reductase
MNDNDFMRQALDLAKKGEGFVEPNPMVGCVLVQNDQIIGQGYHTQFGQPHAEVEAIRSTNADLTGATCYVTLEPCSHYGKTPPCTQAILQTGIRRVVIAMRDPNPEVDGKGIQILREAGLDITEGVLEKETRWLNAPYLTLLEKNRPWIHAKWAMTLDGRLASKTHNSKWITGEESRKIVHQLRSRMDAIVIGAGTALHDDPLLTVRLNESESLGNKIPCRVILGDLSPESQLVQTAREVPVLIVTATRDVWKLRQYQESGCEVLRFPRGKDSLCLLLRYFASRKWTHVLVEGGLRIFGTFFDAKCIDEVHAFIAPLLIGGAKAIPVIGGDGLEKMSLAAPLESPVMKLAGYDVYVRGRIRW